jgi:capsular exopolysaccharide synthesis family protein
MSLPLPSAPPGSAPGAPTAAPGGFAAALAGARRRWILAGLAGALLGSGAAAAYYTQTPQKYTVTTTLQISSLDSLLHENDGANSVQRDAEYRRNQAALIRTRPVALKALETKKVADSSLFRNRTDPAGWLEGELKTAQFDGGQLRVSLTGENPDELADALNAVTASYLALIVGAEEDQRRARVDELDKVLTTSEDRIRKQRNDERALAETLRAADTPSIQLRHQWLFLAHGKLFAEQFGLESLLLDSRSQLEDLKAQLEAARVQPIPGHLVAEALAAVPEVKTATGEVTSLWNQLDNGTVTDGTVAYTRVAEELMKAAKHLETVKKKHLDGVLKDQRDQLVRQIEAKIAKAEESIRVTEHRLSGLKTKVDAANQEAEKIGSRSFELELKRAEIAEAEAIMRKLRGEKERLAIEMQTHKRRVNVTTPAEGWAARPAASAVTASAGLGIAGLALGVLGVGYLESRRRRLIHSNDVAQAMKLQVLGTLPLVPALDGAPLSTVWGDRLGLAGSVLIEAVNDLRTMLLTGNPEPGRVVVVTSAEQGEGKTTVACLLALSLAQIGKRTLIVDGDLRNPQVASRLGLTPVAGLGEVLRGEARPLGVVGGVPGTPLAVMTAGRPCVTVIRGLSVERVHQIFAELRTQFDHIIVDSCPTPLTDGLVLGACADATVLVVRSGHSKEPIVREACERMIAARVPLVGGIVNGVPFDRRWLRYPYVLPPAAQAPEPAAV